MDEKMEITKPCRCGAEHPIIAKIKPGLYICGCGHCPAHARGATEAEAIKNWNKEVQR